MSRTDNENIPNSCQQQTQQSTELNSSLPDLHTINFFSHMIHCFRVEREYLLLFPEVLCKVLYEYSYLDVLTACEYFKITFVECDPAQLKSLKQSNMLREDEDCAYLICKIKATRLCEAIAKEMESCKDPPFELRIFHECFGRCEGLFQLRFHLSLHSPCIRCQYCFEDFNPLEFVVHCHPIDEQPLPKYGPKVNPAKWWKYIFAYEEEWQSQFLTKRMLNELKYRYLDHSQIFPTSKRRFRRRTQSLKHAVVHSPLTGDSINYLSQSEPLLTSEDKSGQQTSSVKYSDRYSPFTDDLAVDLSQSQPFPTSASKSGQQTSSLKHAGGHSSLTGDSIYYFSQSEPLLTSGDKSWQQTSSVKYSDRYSPFTDDLAVDLGQSQPFPTPASKSGQQTSSLKHAGGHSSLTDDSIVYLSESEPLLTSDDKSGQQTSSLKHAEVHSPLKDDSAIELNQSR